MRNSTYPPAAGDHFAAFLAAARPLGREEIEAAIDELIARLDLDDGDADLEENDVEDSFALSPDALAYASARPRSINGDEVDMAWREWQPARRAHRINSGAELYALRSGLPSEDDEDDDADTGVEDDPRGIDPEEDFGAEELGEDQGCSGWLHDASGADPALVRLHRDRIRRTRCTRSAKTYGTRTYVDYRLRYSVSGSVAVGVAADLL